MATNRIRTRLVTACLATMLLPVSAALALSVITPKSDFGVIAPWELPSVSQGKVTAVRSADLWSPEAFVLFRAEATGSGRVEVSPAKPEPEPSKAPSTAPAVQRPGTVQNLRWADKP